MLEQFCVGWYSYFLFFTRAEQNPAINETQTLSQNGYSTNQMHHNTVRPMVGFNPEFPNPFRYFRQANIQQVWWPRGPAQETDVQTTPLKVA